MSDVDVKSLLGRKIEETEAPKPVPPGHYRAVAQKHEFGTSRNGTTRLRYSVILTEPQEDVDQEAFAKYGGYEKLQKRPQRLDFWITEDAMHRLRDFLENTLKLEIGSRNYDEVIPEAHGREFIACITHTMGEDGKPYSNIDSTLPVE